MHDDIGVEGGCDFTPGFWPDSPAAVPGLMGFVEGKKGPKKKSPSCEARLLPDGSGYEQRTPEIFL